MTTIVFRDGVLAADTRSIRGDRITPGIARKIGRNPDGTLWAVTGELAEAMAFVRDVQDGVPKPRKIPDTATVILIKPTGLNGVVQVNEGEGWFEYGDIPFVAFGSGMAPALGALYQGATAEEAVRIAAKVDPGTGPDVMSLRLFE